VRLYLTSAMLRLDPSQRWDVVDALSQKAEDQNDHNLPLMVWYAAEPLAALDMKRALQLAEKSKLPDLLPYTIRRVAAIGTEDSKKALKELNEKLGQSGSHRHHEHQLLIGKVLDKQKEM
jgi:hypothetical protein